MVTIDLKDYYPMFDQATWTIEIEPNITLQGNTTIGDSSSDTLTVTATPTFTASPTFTLGDGEVITINATDASGGAVAPFVYTSVMDIAGATGGRAFFTTQCNAAAGGWINAIKGYMNFDGTSGSTSGLASGICAELKTPNRTLPSGAYYPMEVEYVAGGTSVTSNGSGSRVGFIYMQNTVDLAGDFDSNGYLFTAAGLTAGAGNILSAQSITLKVQTGLAGSENTRYLVMSTTENSLVLATTGGTSIEVGTCTTGLNFNGTLTTDISFSSGGTIKSSTNTLTFEEATLTFTGSTAINLDGPTTITGAVILENADATGQSFNAANSTAAIAMGAGTKAIGLNCADVCTIGVQIGNATTGISLDGDFTDGIKIASGNTITDGFEIASACTNGINFSSTFSNSTVGILFANGFLGKAIKIGSLSSDTPGSGCELDDTNTRAVEVNADDNNSSLLTATLARAIMGRYMVYANSSNENWGIDGLCKWSAVASTGNVTAGITGRFETTGICSTATGSGNTYCAGLMGRVGTGGSFTIGAGTYVACVLAFGNNANSNAFTNTGYHAFHAALTDVGTAEVFDYGLFIEDSASTAGIYVGDCTSGIVFGTCSGTGIDFPAGETYAKALAYGEFGTPISFSDDEPFEIHGRLSADAKVKPLMRVRCSTPDGVAMTTGEVHAIQAQGYNTSTSDAAVIEALQGHVGIKANCEIIADIESEEPNMRAGWLKIEDLGYDLTLTGTACVLNLGMQWNAGTTFTGNCDWIKLVKKGSLTTAADAFIRVYDGAGGGWATVLMDIPARAPVVTADKSGGTKDYALQMTIGGSTHYIQCYSAA